LFDALTLGDLELFEQVVDRRCATGRDPDPFAVSLRAIALTMRGFTAKARALLATVEISPGWTMLAHAIIARAGCPRAAAPC
jgi:hypothetical protein